MKRAATPTAVPIAVRAAPPVTTEQALRAHREGRIPEAIAAYEQLLRRQPGASALRHNLGLLRLGRGELAQALAQLDRAWVEDSGADGWTQSLPLIGMTLVQHGCWEDALPWLERAVLRGCSDPAVAATLQRCRLPAHLAPEAFDPVQGRTLRRPAPRESSEHVYAIDVVGTCNLRCPTCPVGNSTGVGRPKGFMDPALFERILDKVLRERVSAAPQIWLFNWGEPLLHPELPRLITAVRTRGLRCHLSSNLNVAKGLREVAKAAPDDFKISLSGFTPERYAQTHAGGELHLVKSNMYELRHWLDHYKAPTRVWVGHHLYRDGHADLPAVKALCDELGFEHHPIPAFFQPVERLIDVLDGRLAHAPVLQRLIEPPQVYLPRLRAERDPDADCELRFNQTVINHDGSVALCCSVYEPANMLGRSFVDTPHAALMDAKYAHPFCATCMDRGTAYTVRSARRVGPPPAP